jgi:hypothetical protein
MVRSIGVHRKARCTLGSLEVLSFEMLFVRRHRSNDAPGNKEKIMVDSTDPPSDERKRAEFWKRGRGICRSLVNRQTLMIAIRTLNLIVRLVEILKRLFGDF